MGKKKENRCEDCNCLVSLRATRCRSCANTREKNPNYKHGIDKGNYWLQKKCATCGKLVNDKATLCPTCNGKSELGENHPGWKGGLKQLCNNHSHGEYMPGLGKWKRGILIKDSNECKCCRSQLDLHIHHIKSWAKYPDLRLDENNGTTLCQVCHKKLHGKYGHDVTPKQLKSFITRNKIKRYLEVSLYITAATIAFLLPIIK